MLTDQLNLSALRKDQVLHIAGDDGDHVFQVTVSGSMPIGILQNYEKKTTRLAQCVGMVGFNHQWNRMLPELEPSVLKCEYGLLVFLAASDIATPEFTLLCVSEYSVEG